MYESILSNEFLSAYKGKNPKWGFNGMGYFIYKRTYSRKKDDGTSEEWNETIQRCIEGAQKIGAGYTKEEAERLYDYIFNLKCNFAGRMLWQLGTSLVEKFSANSLLNCWMTQISKPEDFCFVFENLMLGGGVGFSVRREDVHELPKIKKSVIIKHESTKDADFIVPDSRQGWIALLRKVLDSFFITGKSFSYSTILIRGAGELIKTFGGTASGPVILVEGIEKICKVFAAREGKKLRSIDALDVCNIIGSIVVSGNVRRSAEIALGDPDDVLFLRAKRWDLGNVPNYRAMSNNTIYADSYDHIMDEVWNGYNGNGEPYGFFNLPLSQKFGRLKDGKIGDKHPFINRDDNVVGMNPCQPGWATILTKSGLCQLRDVKEGDKIWSETGWTTILKKWSNGTKPVYAYRTTAGVFYGTKNHRLIVDGQKIEAQYCDSIDTLKGPRDCYVELSPQDVIDGLVFGDGSVHKASNNLIYLCIGKDDYDYFKSEIKGLIKECRTGISDYAYEVETSITAEELPKTFDREIPDRFYYGDYSKKIGFLRGLYTANGSIVGNRITLKASSFKVIQRVQIMLSSIGIRSYYTTNKSKSIEFENGEYQCRESYDLNVSTDRNIFNELIGFIQVYKNDKVKALLEKSESSHSHKQPKITFDIISEELISEEEVFDITVDNSTHTYWTGGLNVSNCGEIPLADKESCNLSELYLNNISSEEELIDCAKLLYKTQKAVAAMPFLHEETNKVVHKNMRLGLGITGVCQSLHKLEWLDNCYIELRKFDKIWSAERGWPESIKLTTTKPSGTLSLLAGATPGVHPAFSEYYIRRVRIASTDGLVKTCKDLGYHTEFVKNFDGSEDHQTVIVEFPCESGVSALLTKNMSAIKQLEIVRKIQEVWSDNAVSVTVYYRKEELEDIREWLKINYEESLKSVSFLLFQEHGFKQAPYEEISEDAYNRIKSKIKPIEIVSELIGEVLDLQECAGGACPIK